MNRLGFSMGLSLIVSFLFSPLTFSEPLGGVQSLRGGTEISDNSVPAHNIKWQHDVEPIPRQFIGQPPVIPHKVEGYKVNIKFNKCLTCHSWSNYKSSNATKISLTHFVDREGDERANIAPRRYFCLQCHVPQKQVNPLVGNSFEPIELLDIN